MACNDEIKEKYQEALDFKINEYFSNEWFNNYKLSTFIKRMKIIYDEYD